MIEERGLIKINPGLLATLSKGGLYLDVFAKEVVVLQCLVAGTSFRSLNNIEDQLVTSVKLSIQRESKNEHDPFAVSIWYEKTKVGYVPKGKNEVIARLMDAGKSFHALIEEKDREGNWLKLKVEVYLQD